MAARIEKSFTAQIKPMDVSFIIVSWNAKEYLIKCLDSLARWQGAYNSEIIVVDNASTDGSPEAVRSQFPYVRLMINPRNMGFGRANNKGIQMAGGRYVCLINSDVEVLNHCIESLLHEMDAHPEIGMMGPRLLEKDGTTQTSCWGFPGVWNMFCCAVGLDRVFPNHPFFNGYEMRHLQMDETRDVDILGGAFWFARRKAVSAVGLLDENFFMYGEDMDWCKRFWKNGWPIRFYPGAEAIHYGGASSANSPVRFHVEMQRANLQ